MPDLNAPGPSGLNAFLPRTPPPEPMTPDEREWARDAEDMYPVRMTMAIPIWAYARSLDTVISMFRARNPTLNPTSGEYKHERRRAWCRDRRCLAMVFMMPDLAAHFEHWAAHAGALLQLRAANRHLAAQVHLVETKEGDCLATLATGRWLLHIAQDIAEFEDDLAQEWETACEEAPQGTIWQYEADEWGPLTGNIWHSYDDRAGFARWLHPGGLARELYSTFCMSIRNMLVHYRSHTFRNLARGLTPDESEVLYSLRIAQALGEIEDVVPGHTSSHCYAAARYQNTFRYHRPSRRLDIPVLGPPPELAPV